MDSVIITGVSGFLGKALAYNFLQKGWNVYGMSRSNPNIPGLMWGAVDFTTTDTVEVPPLFKDTPIIHCAALTKDTPYNQTYYDVNVKSTNIMLNINPGSPFIHISSSSIYNLTKPTINAVEEDFSSTQYKFLNGYSQTKAEAENLVLNFNREHPPVSLRPHALYGVGDTTLMPKIRKRVKMGTLVLPNGGKVKHSLTNIENMVQAVEKALQYTPTQPEAFNITDAEPVILAEALKTAIPEIRNIVSIKGFMLKTVINAGLVSNYEVAQISATRTYNITKAQHLLNYKPTNFQVNW